MTSVNAPQGGIPAPAPVVPPAQGTPPAGAAPAPADTPAPPPAAGDTATIRPTGTGPLEGSQQVDFTDAQATAALGKIARNLSLGSRQDKERLITAFCQQLGITRDEFDMLADRDSGFQLSHEQVSRLRPDQRQELSRLGGDPQRVNAYIDHQAANLQKGESA